MRNPIYVPKGRAREYSPWALNIYSKCPHGCDYCYNNRFGSFQEPCPDPRDGIIDAVADQLLSARPDGQVLISFMGDPYGPASDDNYSTYSILELLRYHRVPVAILTKAGSRCLKDISLFKGFGPNIQVGASLTYWDEHRSAFHEPGAASPVDRIQTLKALHDAGIRTFVSFEPVIAPHETLRLMDECMDYMDSCRIGKLNGHKTVDLVDWGLFTDTVVHLLRSEGKPFYIKDSLAAFAKPGLLTDEERDPDRLCLRWDG